MAELLINSPRLLQNIRKLSLFLQNNNIQWTLVTKILGGNRSVLEKILNSDVIGNCHSIGDSRLSSLKTIKAINPEIVTAYIKLPAISNASSIVKYADISLNSSFHTICALNKEAKKHNKIHRIIVMIEMGELREGVVRDDLLRFYEQVFCLPFIEIVGLGTNLGCMHGVEPSYDKLIQLSLYRQLLEAKFDRKIELISGGSSITLPLISLKKIPPAVNHFRIGEAAFMGTTPLTGKRFQQLNTNSFEFAANIIETALKEDSPDGNICEGNIGFSEQVSCELPHRLYRLICDFGLVDVDARNLLLKDNKLTLSGTTSDMTVYSLEKCDKSSLKKYSVGNKIRFQPNYMAVARLMNSRFIEKFITE